MKLSDALRGAADRAPVDDATVAVGAVAGRVKRQRAVRAGSTGLVGAGAVAVLAFGAVGLPMAGSDESDDSVSMEAGADAAMDDGEIATEESLEGATADSRLAFALCGGTVDSQEFGEPSIALATRIGSDEVEPGSSVEVSFDATALADVDLLTAGPDYVVTWDGIVVGAIHESPLFAYGPADEMVEHPDGLQDVVLAEGETSTATYEVDLVNCWDGTPLPSGKYEIHAWQSFASTADSTGDGEMTPEPSASEEVVESMPDDGSDDAGDASGGGEGDGMADSTVSSGEPGPVSPDASALVLEQFRVAAQPVALVIGGEPVDDPFADYLTPLEPEPAPEPVEPEPLPDGYLTPEAARELFDQTRAGSTWSMAAGTQRWVVSYDARRMDEEQQWYGCVWGDGQDARFPSESAEMGLLDVSVDLPTSISVSYGFVVDGNPVVSSEVRNVSDYTIPNFWDSAQPALYLVQDGRVVAEGYPESLDRGGYGIERAMDGAAVDELSVLPWPGGDGLLEPGESTAGDFLWRDVNGCASEDGSWQVGPGTYTVLTMQSLSLSNDAWIAYGDVAYNDVAEDIEAEQQAVLLDRAGDGDDAVDLPTIESPGIGGAATSGSSGSSGLADVGEEPDTDVAIAPAPDGEYDWIDLQVWTSLGTVTVR
ncbi:hypothetical protein [uncultured Demequina sp.]|uniref:hypothetical protein n=1 Tax=uncultured Demequina sp. TaxID=693499 RepID=UPI0025FEF6D9|nr:hypothetical protein [uncultured Demequina sp.]